MPHPPDYQFCPYDGSSLVPGNTAPPVRPACPRCGFVEYRNAVACATFFILQGGRVLLARRGVSPAKGEWDILGGFVDENESIEEAVRRETREEIGLAVESVEYLGSIPDVYGPRRNPVINLYFLVQTEEGDPVAASDVASVEWFALDALPQQMAFPNQKRAFDLLLQRLARS
jgi:NADH pyrophosphatase NudC (nudix superfamily)